MVLKNQAVFKKVGFLGVSLLFFLSACNSTSTSNNIESNINISYDNPYIYFLPPQEWYLPMFAYLEEAGRPYGGMGIGLATRSQVEADLAMHAGEEIEDFELPDCFATFNITQDKNHLYLAIFSSSASAHIYTVSLFLNYEPIAFRVLGEEDYNERFDLVIPRGYHTFIPFVLDSERLELNANYRLTVAVFVDKHIHASEWAEREDFEFLSRVYYNDPWWSPMMLVLNYDLITGAGGIESFDFLESDIDERVYLSLRVGPELLIMSTEDSIILGVDPLEEFLLDRRIEASPGEELRFSAWAQPSTSLIDRAEDYLIISLLNAEQIPMNGNPFLYVNLADRLTDKPFAERIDFTIIAPLIPGKYEFVSFIITNPTRSAALNYELRELTPRVTIVVSE